MNEMRHCKFYKLAHLYPVDALNSDEKREFEEHMKNCDECRRIVTEARVLSDMFRAPAEQPDTGFEQRIMRNIRAGAQGSRAEPAFVVPAFARKLMPVAAIFCVVMFFMTLFVAPRVPVSAGTVSSEAYLQKTLTDTELDMISDDYDTAVDSYYAMIMPL